MGEFSIILKINKRFNFRKCLILFVLSLVIFSIFSPVTCTQNISTEEQYKLNESSLLLEYLFNFPEFKEVKLLNQFFTRIGLEKYSNFKEESKPILPIVPVKILMPYGEEFVNIEVSIEKTEKINLNYPVEPGQKVYPISYKAKTEFSTPNPSIYNSDNLYPKKIYEIVTIQQFRGYKILILRLYPIQYNPRDNQILFHSTINIEKIITKSIESNKIDSYHQNFRGLQKDIDATKIMSENPNTIESYPGPFPSHTYEYVIITNNELKNYNGVNNFQDLCNQHNLRGLNTNIVTMTEIQNNFTGVDLQEKIRNFIKYAYNNWHTEYILIGGDDEIIPTRMLWAWVPIFGYVPIASDLYYCCLDGSYDDNGNGYYGEIDDGEGGGDVDLIAEVYIGRASVNNTQELSNFVYKTLEYTNSSEEPYSKKALLAGELLWEDEEGTTWAADYLDDLVDIVNTHNYTTYGIPSSIYSIDKLYDKTWPDNNWPKEELIDRINTNIHLINHLGHSSGTYNMKMIPDDVNLLTNSKFSFIYSQGCMAGAFKEDDCMAEYFTIGSDTGAFAAIMNSHFGVGQHHSTDGPSQRYNREFWDAIFGEFKFDLGRANQDSKEDNLYRINEICMRLCYYELNLFGDPATEILHGPCRQLAFSPNSFSCEFKIGESVNISFDVWNLGDLTLNYSFIPYCSGSDSSVAPGDGCKYINVNPVEGNSTGEHDKINVRIDTAEFDKDNKQDTYGIFIVSNGGNGSITINLKLDTNPKNNMRFIDIVLSDFLKGIFNKFPLLRLILERFLQK